MSTTENSDRVPFLLRMAGRPHVYAVLELVSENGHCWIDAKRISKILELSLPYTQCLLGQAARAGLLERKTTENPAQAEVMGRKPYVYRVPDAIASWLVTSRRSLQGEAAQP